MSVVLLAALSLALAQQAGAAPSANDQAQVDPAAAEREAALDREVCRRERVLGSNRPERICMTVRQWHELRDQSRQDLSRTDRGGIQTLEGAGGAPSN